MNPGTSSRPAASVTAVSGVSDSRQASPMPRAATRSPSNRTHESGTVSNPLTSRAEWTTVEELTPQR